MNDTYEGLGDPGGGTENLVRIAIFDTRPLMAEGLAALLSGSDGIDIVGATSQVDEVIRMIDEARIHVVVLSVESRSVKQLGDLVAQFRAVARAAGTSVEMVGVVPDGKAIPDRYGLVAVPTLVTTAVSPAALRSAIVSAFSSRRPTLPLRLVQQRTTYTSRPVQPKMANQLTRRERDVLRGIEQGLSTKEIAESLDITVNTVRTHVQHLLSKLGVHSRLSAAALAADAAPSGDEGP